MSNDSILNGYIKDFITDFDVKETDASIVFEHFVTYCIVARQYPKEFDFFEFNMGGEKDTGIDGIAVIVNNKIVTKPEHIDDIFETDSELSVRFIFIQAKTSKSFKGSDFSNFATGVKNLFYEKGVLEENEKIARLREIKDRIYDMSINFVDTPKLEMFYVTQGEWLAPTDIEARAGLEKNDLKDTNNFSTVDINFIDADKLKKLYKELKGKVIREATFDNCVSLPEINEVRQALVGSMPVSEFLSLITDSDGNLQKNLFEDNVRDYQGANKVNKSIEKTLKNQHAQAALPVLHNGVTIVAQKVERINKKVKLTDFQIVNGCQSSHVLFNNKEHIEPDTHIVVKVIETQDYEFATSIVRATNQQTEVKEEAFESLSKFHKDLEDFYLSKAKDYETPIYYERRSKQYDGASHVKSHQVVNLSSQVSAYVAGELAQPQSTHRYYGELLKSNRSKIFQEKHKLEVYYLLALINKKIEQYFKENKSLNSLKLFRYHFLLIVYRYYRILMKKGRKSFDYCFQDLYSGDGYIKVIELSGPLMTDLINKSKQRKNNLARSKTFTNDLLLEIDKQFESIE